MRGASVRGKHGGARLRQQPQQARRRCSTGIDCTSAGHVFSSSRASCSWHRAEKLRDASCRRSASFKSPAAAQRGRQRAGAAAWAAAWAAA